MITTKIYNIGGKDRDIRFNMMALDLLSSRTNISLSNLAKPDNYELKFFLEILYAGAYGGARPRYADPDPRLSYEEVISWLDEGKSERDVLTKVVSQFADSISFLFGDEEDKKEPNEKEPKASDE